MDIRTFGELIDWTRNLHQELARCLAHCASRNEEERASALLTYLSSHEEELVRIVDGFKRQSEKNTLETRVYDYLHHNPIQTHRTCDGHYADLDFQGIYREVMDFHDQVTDLYRTLASKAEIPEARELFESLLEMETHESMRLARQIGRMDDV
ncbi:ATPase [Marinobacter salicampi]|uniref:ATPase n=1 Tax=Marinobacter salicampi TaxID=435907 RepID=UPI00140B42D9|nr:ATPase [Marinobacter salicampi]